MIKKVLSTILLVLATSICTEGHSAREVIDELSGSLGSEGKLVWYDARLLGVEGKGWEKTESFYDRLPVKAKGVVPEGIWELGHCSSGLLIRFDTDSEDISIRWSLTAEKLEMPHMPATGVSGIDLYFRDENSKFRTCGYGRPKEQANEVAISLPPSDEYILYLPLYNGVVELELGISKGETLTKFPSPEVSESIVFYGTSITQGGCASRPGMNATSIAGRELDRPIINLGFSGSARMEMEIAELLCDLNPAVFVLDSLWNMNLEMIAERAGPFVRKLRMERPTTPVILVEDSTIRNLPTAKGDLFRQLYRQLKSEGDENIYMLSNTGMLGEDWEATVDGVHLTDLGMHRQAEVFVSTLQGILAR